MRRTLAIVNAIALLGVACEASTTSSPTPAPVEDGRTHVVLDTDLAFDDIMALLYLAQRDEVVLDAVTITGTGEAHCDPGVRNARALLALGGAPDVPVACGRETPLSGSNAFPDEWRAAVDDLSMLGLPEVDGAADPRGAVGLLLDELEGDTVLLTLGPLTNVAEALRQDPSLAGRVPSFIAMAGAIDASGNTPYGVAEYNIFVDPLAAREVIEGMDVTLVPLDATEDVPFTAYFVEALERHTGTPVADAVAAMIHANEPIFTSEGYQFWDTLATALVLDPDLASWDEATVSVTASDVATAGWIDRSASGAAVRFATGVAEPLAFERDYLSTITGEEVDDVRPEPSLAVDFDGERCEVSHERIAAGRHDVAFATEVRDSGAVVIAVDGRVGYDELAGALGAPGSEVTPRDPVIRQVEPFAFLADLTPVEMPEGTLVAVCLIGDEQRPGGGLRAWMSSPITAVG